MNQKFSTGDLVVTLDGFTCKIVMPILDEDGWWYEVEPFDFVAPFNREIKQDELRRLEGSY